MKSLLIDNYLNSLDFNDNVYTLTEDDNKISNLFKSALSKFNLSSDQKKEGNKNIEEIQKSAKFKRISKIVRGSISGDNDLDKVKLGKGLKKELGPFLGENSASIVFTIIFVLKVLLVRGKNIAHITNIVSLLVTLITELSPALITKIVTRNKKSLIQIQKDIENNKEVIGISAVQGILAVVSLLVFILTLIGGASISLVGAGLVTTFTLIIVSLIKLIYASYIGIKFNSWKYQEKLLKKKGLTETIDYSLRNYIDSAIFISSLRENLMFSAKSLQTKNFILNEATDYQIINFVINGQFPEKRDGDYSNLLDIFLICFGEEIVPIQEHNISTIGLTGTILTETLRESDIFSNNVLLEATVNQSTLSNLEKLLKAAKHNLAQAMKKNLESNDKKTSEEYTQAGIDFQNAKERYKQYKETGYDPGDKAYGGGQSSTGQSGSSSYSGPGKNYNSWEMFTIKILNFKPGAAIKNIFSKVYGAQQLSKLSKMNKSLSGMLITLTGVALASLFIYASYKGYQRFLSIHAKECSKFSFKEKTICMKKAEIKASEERVIDLKKVIEACGLLKKKQERINCKVAFMSRIDDLKKEVKILKVEVNAA